MKGSNFLYIILLLIGLYFIIPFLPQIWVGILKDIKLIFACIISWNIMGFFIIGIKFHPSYDDILFTPNWKPIKYLLLPLTIPWTIVLIIIRVFNKYFSTGAAKEHYKHIKILS